VARSLRRRIGVLPYVANGISRLELPRNHVYKTLMLRLTGLMTVAGGAADGTLTDEQPMALLRDIRIIRNGSEVLQSIDGGTAFRIAALNYGVAPPLTPLAIPGVQANTAFEAFIPLDFASYGLSNQSLSFLRAVGTSSLFLEITWGNEGTMITSGDRTETLSAVQVAVESHPEIMDLVGTYADKYVRIIDRQVTAASARFEIDMERGPTYQRIILKSTDEKVAAAGQDTDLDNNIINSVKVILDGQLYLLDEIDFDQLRAVNKVAYQQETMADGYAVIDFCEDGNPAGMIATAEATEFKVQLDVSLGTGVTRVKAIPISYTAARAALVG